MLGCRQQGELGGTRAGPETQEGGGGQVDGDEEAGHDDSEAQSGRETFPTEDGGGGSQRL